MTLTDDSTRQKLWETLSGGDTGDLIRESVRVVFQELIEAEAAAVIGAARYERSPDRKTARNGHRPRSLSTPAGDLELKIPKFRKGSFMPSVIEPRRRIDRALYAVIIIRNLLAVVPKSHQPMAAAMFRTVFAQPSAQAACET